MAKRYLHRLLFGAFARRYLKDFDWMLRAVREHEQLGRSGRNDGFLVDLSYTVLLRKASYELEICDPTT